MTACDIFVLHNYSHNGFGIAVVAVPPGETPWRRLHEWFVAQNYKTPEQATDYYRVVDQQIGAATEPGVIVVAEYFDGILQTGRKPPKKTDYGEWGNAPPGIR